MVTESAKKVGPAWDILTPDTRLTGSAIDGDEPLPVSIMFDLGDNMWIVGALNGAYVKMVKIMVTGETTFDWIGASYTQLGTGCDEQQTFTESCFTNGNRYKYEVILKAIPIIMDLRPTIG